jgi:hypothetical protein
MDTAVEITAGTGTSIDTRQESTNDHHRQVIVIGDPTANAGVAPVDGTSGVKVNLGSDNDVVVSGTVTADLGATDNAVLDSIASTLTTIESNQLSDSHNVTVDNASIAVTGSFYQATQPVSGTVTANLSATDNGVLDQIELNQDSQTAILTTIDADTGAIKTAVEVIDNAIAGNEMQVDIVSGTLTGITNDVSIDDGGNSITVDGTVGVSGTVTVDLGANNDVTVTGIVTAELSATDNAVLDTIDAVLDQIELNQDSQTAILTTIDADTGSIKTAVEVLDNAISGNEMQVDVVASLPAGTNNIGDVDLASAIPAGTNIIGAVKRDTINYTPIRKYYSYTGAVTDGVIWDPTAGKKFVITDIALTTSAAATVTVEEDIATDVVLMAFDLAANGGVSMNLQTPIYASTADANLVVTTTAGNIKIMVTGYEV